MKLKEARNILPESITIDYESAEISSFKKNFPDTTLYGCFFHFSQCLWRKIQLLGLKSWYRESNNSILIKMVQSLAFLPFDDVIKHFNAFLEFLNVEADEILESFFIYFEATWLGSFKRNKRKKPLYDIEMWNLYNRTIENIPRTTNSVEVWHNAFQIRVNLKNPTLSRIISKIKKEQRNLKISIEQSLVGNFPRVKKNKYFEMNKRLIDLVKNYNNIKGLDYLRSISSNL